MSTDFRFTLEKYSGTKTKHVCPKCNRRKLVLYVDNSTGNHLHSSVGKCDSGTCGYHLTPKEYFSSNGQIKDLGTWTPPPPPPPKPVEYVPQDVFYKSLFIVNERTNTFMQGLEKLFDRKTVLNVADKYLIGSTKSGGTIFWQVDTLGRVRTGKVMQYDPKTLKRSEKFNFIHNLIREGFNFKQCFFGLHLLQETTNQEKVVALVESEKTAIICSVLMPQFVWLACGGCQMLSFERMAELKDRTVVLCPDVGLFDKWSAKAKEFESICDISVSDLMERKFPDRKNMDFADYLLTSKNQPHE